MNKWNITICILSITLILGTAGSADLGLLSGGALGGRLLLGCAGLWLAVHPRKVHKKRVNSQKGLSFSAERGYHYSQKTLRERNLIRYDQN